MKCLLSVVNLTCFLIGTTLLISLQTNGQQHVHSTTDALLDRTIQELHYDSALLLLNHFSKAKPQDQNFHELYSLGRINFETEKFQKCISYCQLALTKIDATTERKHVTRTNFLIIESYLNLNQLNKAEAQLEQLESKSPYFDKKRDKAALNLIKAILLSKKNKLAKASDLLAQTKKAIISLNDTTLIIKFKLLSGDLASINANHPKAFRFYQEARELSLNSLNKYLLGVAYHKLFQSSIRQDTNKYITSFLSNKYPVGAMIDYHQELITTRHFKEENHVINEYYSPLYTEKINCLAIDKNDIIFSGSDVGLAEYRGERGRTIRMSKDKAYSNATHVLQIDKEGTAFVGGRDYFGFIKYNEQGQPLVHFLHETLPKSIDFDEVNHICFIDDKVYFCSSHYLIEWHNNRLKVHKTHSQFNPFSVNNKLWVWKKHTGLLHLNEEGFSPVENGAAFSKVIVKNIISITPTKFMIITQNSGVIIYEKGKIQLLQTKLNSYLKSKTINCAIPIENHLIGIGTNTGILIIDKNGKLKHEFNKENGLFDAQVNGLFYDKQQSIWAALKTGICRIEYPNPLINFSDDNGLEDVCINSIEEFNDRLYLATDKGLKYLPNLYHETNNQEFLSIHELKTPLFSTVADINGKCRSMLRVDNSLFISTSSGLFEINSEFNTIQHNHLNTTFIHQPKSDSSRLYVGLSNGLAYMEYQDGTWKFQKQFSGFDEYVNSLAEDVNHGISMGTKNGICRFTPHDEKFKIYPVKKNTYQIIKILDRLFGQTETGPFPTFVPSKDSFDLSPIFDTNVFGAPQKDFNFFFQTDRAGNHYFVNSVYEDRYYIIDQNNDTLYSDENLPFWSKKIREMGASHVMFHDQLNRLWLGFQNGDLYRYDGRIKQSLKQPYKAFIRKVLINDSLLGKVNDTNQAIQEKINYANNQVKFWYSALAPNHKNSNEYWTWLEGFEPKPLGKDSWSSVTHEQYNNLSEGRYVFHVIARNHLKQLSEESLYKFTILPPWYRTQWAYLVYIALLVLVIAQFIQWRNQKKLIRIREQQNQEMKIKYEKENREKEKEIYQMQTAQMQLKALRSQMNPHFTFNAMAAIQNLILKEKKQEALQSISDFSMILRKTLDHSDFMYISLKEEIDFIQSYLDVEKLRFESKLESNIELTPNIQPEVVFIPSMIIQPYVENAVKHGLLHRKSHGKLWIKFRLEANILYCTIEDNGVGRAAASKAKFQFRNGIQHTSKGMSITEKRLELINNLSDSKVFLQIFDLVDENNEPKGTRIELTIPINQNQN